MLSQAQLDDLRRRRPLAELAVELGARLNRRGVGSCPICGGGRSAQRFEIKRGGPCETWVCAVCQAGGDAISLVERVRGVSFVEAVEYLGGAAAIDPALEARLAAEREAKRVWREAEAARYREDERRRLYRMWRAARPYPGTPIEDYLRGRGIENLFWLRLKFAADLPFFHGEVENERGRKVPRAIHRGPAMLAAFICADGRFSGLHITWIDPARPGEKAAIVDPDTGELINAKKMRGSKAGAFLDVVPGAGDGTWVVAGEGIETVLSVRDCLPDGWSYRVAGDLGNLAGAAEGTVAHPTLKGPGGRPLRAPGPEPRFDSPAMPVPENCVELVLLKDGDSDPFTTDCAMQRGAARHARPGRRVRIAAAPAGLDFNDVLRGKGVDADGRGPGPSMGGETPPLQNGGESRLAAGKAA